MFNTKHKEIKTYLVVIVLPDNTIKSVFSGRFVECMDVANHLIDRHRIRKDKIVFLDEKTYEIANIQNLMGSYGYRNFGYFGKKRRPMPWEQE